MPFTKIIKCSFCGKKITTRKYDFSKGKKRYHSCSACRWFYDVMRKEIEQDRFVGVRRILNCIISDKKHCTICNQYRSLHPRTCRRGFSTGIGSDYNGYPLSYANHGCSSFARLRML